MEDIHRERLKKVVLFAIPTVLGGMAVRNVREMSQVRHISYWEASKSFILDLIEDGKSGVMRVSGTVSHGDEGLDVQLYDGFEYTDHDVERFETAFKLPVSDSE